MTDSTKDAGVILALLNRLETQRLPMALKLKEKVDSGNRLNDYDIDFLKQVFDDAAQIKPLLDQHPEYDKLVSKLITLYNEITEKSLENEKHKRIDK